MMDKEQNKTNPEVKAEANDQQESGTDDRQTTERVLEIIDLLKNRKARPDHLRICTLMVKKYNIQEGVTSRVLQHLSDTGVLLKVSYKSQYSYKRPTDPDSPNKAISPLKTPTKRPAPSDDAAAVLQSSAGDARTQPVVKLSRCADNLSVPSPCSLPDEVAARCDYCTRPAGSCPKGRIENLLSCSDCSAKAHPACLGYSLELAARALRSPWQCTDCKTCCVCRKSDNPQEARSSLLFCDSCDKGYHMSCVHPPLTDSPQGKWECVTCQAEAEEGASQQTLGEDRRESNTFSDDATNHVGNSAESNGETAEAVSPVIVPPPVEQPAPSDEVPDVQKWSLQQVHDYFVSKGFCHEADMMLQEKIDGVALLLLKRSDILDLLHLKMGPALKLYKHIYKIQYKFCPCNRPPCNY